MGMGHRLLWTTPESLHETLPLIHAGGAYVITADVRLDNRHELISALHVTDPPRENISDAQLILCAYEKWADRCVEKFLGDFAFAIWDRSRQTLFCARDHFGVKPFYYYHSSRAFVFASEIKALLCVAEVPRLLNEVRVADYLLDMTEDEASTFYRDIIRLPPAHTLTVGRKHFALQRYWQLDPEREIHCKSDEEYAEAFREVFTKAVQCRLRSAFPIGSMLSGGIDSSSIVGVARELLATDGNGPLHTFSARHQDPSTCRESPFIDAVLEQGGLRSYEVHSDDLESAVADLDAVLQNQDEPFDATDMFIPRIMYRSAQQQGVRVLLDGVDGDLVVAQCSHYVSHLLRAGKWKLASQEITALAERLNLPKSIVLRRYGLHPLFPQWIQELYRRGRLRRRGDATEENDERFINPEFSRRIGLAERRNLLQGSRISLARTPRDYHLRLLTWGHIPWALGGKYDRAAAVFSVEPRHPFFDRRLVEFCLALPAEQKWNSNWTKVILRRALAETLPEQVRWRTAPGNLGRTFMCAMLAQRQSLIEEVMQSDLTDIGRYIDLKAVCEEYERYRNGHGENMIMIWEVISLTLWLRRMKPSYDSRL
jgi:asparagine synthase (glutamine-hydrolysing)